MKTNEIKLSPYKLVWVEFFPNKGFVTVHDQRVLGAAFPSPRLKTYRKPFGNKAAALAFINRFSNKLDKSYTCLLSTDKQYGMAKESEGYAIPYTKKQLEDKYYINSDPVANVICAIENEGGFDNFNHWNKNEVADWVMTNFYCNKKIALKVAAIIIHGWYAK